MYDWKRREFTTRSSDPTVVVEWERTLTDGSTIVLQEFQGIVRVITDAYPTDAPDLLADILGESLHTALERLHEATSESTDSDPVKMYGGE